MTDHLPQAASARRARGGLLVALAIDNVGSGVFLPLTLFYSTRVLDLSIATAATLLSLGSFLGLVTPLLAGPVVDRAGPKRVVITSQALQCTGVVVYLAAAGWAPGREVLAAVAAVLLAAGTQTFYSALFSLISDVAGAGDKDPVFARVHMVRSASFGIGALLAAGILAGLGVAGLVLAFVLNATSFVVAAVVLAVTVRAPAAPAEDPGPASRAGRAPRPWRDRPFLVLLAVVALVALPGDFFMIGVSVWTVDQLDLPLWLPGVCVALVTVVSSTGAGVAVRATQGWTRVRAVQVGVVGILAWCLLALTTPAVPPSVQIAWVLGITVFFACANQLLDARLVPLADASARPEAHGRYMAMLQYSFNTTQLLAPLVVGLFAIAGWLPWLLVAAACLLGLAPLPWLRRRLPRQAVVTQLPEARGP